MAVVAAALVMHISINLLWPAQQAWLHSTGVFFAVMAVGLVVFVLLASAVRDSLDRALEPAAPVSGAAVAATPLLRWSELRWAATGLLVLLGAFAGYPSSYRAQRGAHDPWVCDRGTPPCELDAASCRFDAWRAPPNGEVMVRYAAAALDGAARIRGGLGALSASGRGAGDVTASGELRGHRRWSSGDSTTLARWRSIFGTIRRKTTRSTSALGTTALAPLPNGQALLLTVTYAAADPARRWDLARALQALPR